MYLIVRISGQPTARRALRHRKNRLDWIRWLTAGQAWDVCYRLESTDVWASGYVASSSDGRVLDVLDIEGPRVSVSGCPLWCRALNANILVSALHSTYTAAWRRK